eukprot:COSAG01_NODE_8458_length_2779_cov_6.544128_1_plen_35_part_10
MRTKIYTRRRDQVTWDAQGWQQLHRTWQVQAGGTA